MDFGLNDDLNFYPGRYEICLLKLTLLERGNGPIFIPLVFLDRRELRSKRKKPFQGRDVCKFDQRAGT